MAPRGHLHAVPLYSGLSMPLSPSSLSCMHHPIVAQMTWQLCGLRQSAGSILDSRVTYLHGRSWHLPGQVCVYMHVVCEERDMILWVHATGGSSLSMLGPWQWLRVFFVSGWKITIEAAHMLASYLATIPHALSHVHAYKACWKRTFACRKLTSTISALRQQVLAIHQLLETIRNKKFGSNTHTQCSANPTLPAIRRMYER
jgi:hypothetical protein